MLWSTAPARKETLNLDWESTQLASTMIDSLRPGSTVELDPDALAYPKPFSQMPAGTYQLMALLDPDGSFLRTGIDAHDLRGPVVQVTLDPAHSAPVDLRLDTRVPFVEPKDPAGVTTVHFESPLLSAFFGEPTKTRVAIAVPDGATAAKPVPTVYLIGGFGGSYDKINKRAAEIRRAMTAPPWNQMAFAYLDGDIPAGHSVFADSVNTGPWSRVLVEELIPYLEKKFPLVRKPEGRFVTGHSSGGWASLWLQVTHPDFFGGTWSTAPDPVDFHTFFGADITPSSTDNLLFGRDGRPRSFFRDSRGDLMTLGDIVRFQTVAAGDRGGPLSTMEWVFSPRGQDGVPLPLFNRTTGEVSPEVKRAWVKYDIHELLASRWKELGPKLGGKIHLVCGAQDSFHLEVSTQRLCDFLKEKGSDATCEMVPGGTHFNLYTDAQAAPNGLLARMVQAMLDQYRAGAKRGKRR